MSVVIIVFKLGRNPFFERAVFIDCVVRKFGEFKFPLGNVFLFNAENLTCLNKVRVDFLGYGYIHGGVNRYG